MTAATSPLASTYAEARRAFLDAAGAAGARTNSWEHPRRGLEDEALYVDVAEAGPASGDTVVLVVSGTHGVEGYLGSALQRKHLETLNAADRSGVAHIFVHALNPFGFSWMRRVNEDNVDLNRNFIDWTNPPPRNDGYREIADLLVPDSWTDVTQERNWALLRTALRDLGPERSQQVVSGGQFDHPTGLFYGGTGPTWSHLWLQDFFRQRLHGVKRATIIDLHTGLGPWGHGELISSDPPGSDALSRQRARWGRVTSLHDGSSVATKVSGDWLGAVASFAPTTEFTGVAIEYGTVDQTSVLQSLRADAVLHAAGDPAGPGSAAIREQVRAAFLDDDPAWLEACWQRYLPVVAAS